MATDPAVDAWFARGATARTAKFADLADVEARKDEFEAVIRAWCALRDGR